MWFALKAAVAVAKRALWRRKHMFYALLNLKRANMGNTLGKLNPVGANVLHGRGPDGAGNSGQVFNAPEPACCYVPHECVPANASPCGNECSFLGFRIR